MIVAFFGRNLGRCNAAFRSGKLDLRWAPCRALKSIRKKGSKKPDLGNELPGQAIFLPPNVLGTYHSAVAQSLRSVLIQANFPVGVPQSEGDISESAECLAYPAALYLLLLLSSSARLHFVMRIAVALRPPDGIGVPARSPISSISPPTHHQPTIPAHHRRCHTHQNWRSRAHSCPNRVSGSPTLPIGARRPYRAKIARISYIRPL